MKTHTQQPPRPAGTPLARASHARLADGRRSRAGRGGLTAKTPGDRLNSPVVLMISIVAYVVAVIFAAHLLGALLR